MGSSIWSSKGPTCEPSSTSLVVNAAATIRPVSASTPMCSLRHDRRRLVPCFSTNHSPAPDSFNPVLSTNRCTGSALGGGPAPASVPARRLSVEWSGIARSRPSRRMTEPISPSVCRRARRNTARRRDRQGRIVRLTAPRGPWLCAPGRNRLFGEPHRQAATLAQGSIIFRPVRYPILLLRNVVTAIGIGLEGHGGHLREVVDGGSTLPSGAAQPDLPPVEAGRRAT